MTAQDPVLMDQLSIEPGEAGTRLVYRSADGSLAFSDPTVTTGLTLSQLAGLQNIGGILVVGKSGFGAAYTTIQSALDVVPASASATNPYIIIVGPGVYEEDITLNRDGVHFFGFGLVVVSSATEDNTITIEAGLGTIPLGVEFSNMILTNAYAAKACVKAVGGASSTVGSEGIRFNNVRWNATGRSFWGTGIGWVRMQGGGQELSGTSALLLLSQCGDFVAQGVDGLKAVSIAYDSTGDLPDGVTNPEYVFSGCNCGTTVLAAGVAADLSGGGSLKLVGLEGAPALDLDGDRAVGIYGSDIGTIDIAESVALTLRGSKRGALTQGGTATVDEPVVRGTAAFTAATSVAVTFDAPMPDTSYTVTGEMSARPASDEVWWVTAKTAAGFTLNFTSAQTLNIAWVATRA